jgi:hypothetical protein
MYILGEYYSDLALNKICFWHFIDLQLYFFFFDVEEGLLGPKFHLLFVDWDIAIKCQKQILFKAKSE